MNDEEIQKVFKHIVPLSDGTQEEISRLFDKWKLYHLTVQTPNLIMGDYPFLINNDDIRLDNIFNEIIFPIGKHKLVSLTDKSPNFLDEILMSNINLSILHQSKRFIAADNEEYLRQLLRYYNKLIQLNLEKNVVKNTFSLMNYQAKFNDYNEYYSWYKLEKEKF